MPTSPQSTTTSTSSNQAIFIQAVTVRDPKTGNEVEIEIYLDQVSGGVFGVDASWTEDVIGDNNADVTSVYSPYNQGNIITINDDGLYFALSAGQATAATTDEDTDDTEWFTARWTIGDAKTALEAAGIARSDENIGRLIESDIERRVTDRTTEVGWDIIDDIVRDTFGVRADDGEAMNEASEAMNEASEASEAMSEASEASEVMGEGDDA